MQRCFKTSSVIAWTFFSTGIFFNFSSWASTNVIYGPDNRRDFYEIAHQNIQNLSHSVAALVSKTNLVKVSGGYQLTNVPTMRDFQIGPAKMCESERFYNQQLLSTCSGFKVASDIMVSAGHCYPGYIAPMICQNYVWVFDYKIDYPGQSIDFLKDDQVYECDSVLKTTQKNGQDYSILKIKKEIKNRENLTLNQNSLYLDQSLFVLGYPLGLPLKFANGAKIFGIFDTYFSTNLDTYKGNSGSPVFDATTNEVVGVVVRGKPTYFQTEEGCLISNRCDNDRENCLNPNSRTDGQHINLIRPIISFLSNSLRQ